MDGRGGGAGEGQVAQRHREVAVAIDRQRTVGGGAGDEVGDVRFGGIDGDVTLGGLDADAVVGEGVDDLGAVAVEGDHHLVAGRDLVGAEGDAVDLRHRDGVQGRPLLVAEHEGGGVAEEADAPDIADGSLVEHLSVAVQDDGLFLCVESEAEHQTGHDEYQLSHRFSSLRFLSRILRIYSPEGRSSRSMGSLGLAVNARSRRPSRE